MPAPTVFAIPGDLDTKTGGYIYERNLLSGLRAAGREVAHLPLQAGFPHPDAAVMADAVARLRALGPERALILDGLVFGAIDTDGLARVRPPVVAMLHHPLALEAGLPAARARELGRRERANLALAAHVVVPSRHTADILQTHYAVAPARVSVAPPGFARPAPARAATDTPPLILSVGILAARKGHDVLLRALAAVRDLPWQARIVGLTHDARVAAALYRLRDELGLGGRVVFTGCIPQAELDALYARAGVFALATRYEGYGMVFSEALLHGLPIVTCRAGAVPDTVPADAGALVPPDDPAAFAQALRRMLSDPAARADHATAAARAGAALPGWDVAAGVMGAALDAAMAR